jgi:hypothetical protein
LVAGVAELHDYVIDHAGQPWIGEQQIEDVMVIFQSVRLANANEPVRLEGVENSVSQLSAGRTRAAGHGGSLATPVVAASCETGG